MYWKYDMIGQEYIPSLGQLFDLYGDLNEIDLWWTGEEIKHLIITQEYTHVITFHRYGFVFYYFDQLVKGEISHEQFITMGDIEGQDPDQINPHVYREEHPVSLTSLTPELVSQWKDTDLVILDKVIYDYYVAQYGAVKSDAKIMVM